MSKKEDSGVVTSVSATANGCQPFAPLPEVFRQHSKSRNKVPFSGLPCAFSVAKGEHLKLFFIKTTTEEKARGNSGRVDPR